MDVDHGLRHHALALLGADWRRELRVLRYLTNRLQEQTVSFIQATSHAC
jgi:hypothetical protein